jgi:hypothetical protein
MAIQFGNGPRVARASSSTRKANPFPTPEADVPTERRNRLMQGLMALVPRPGNWRDWRQQLDMATNTLIPGDWYNSRERRWNNPLEAFGLNQLFNGGHQPTSPLPGWMDPNGPGAPVPPNPQWNGVPGQQPQGQGPLMAYQSPRPRNIRPGGGQVIAEGVAAQNMLADMRTNNLVDGSAARRAMDQMFRGSEK